MNRYVTVKCPSCQSVSQIKADAVRSEYFYCPVCEEGEIVYHPTRPKISPEDTRFFLEWRELVPIYITNR
jgi:hypothetical protein